MNTDLEWEKWGKNDPYFGVLTQEKFRRQNLTVEAKKEFFESGREDINRVLDVCRCHLDQGFSPEDVLDFGCGAGRLIIPFAEIAERVVGLDVSDSMLKEARKNCDEYSVQNISLLKSDDNLSSLHGCFDLIHSVIVFQHIPVERGRKIFTKLLSHLKDGGICAIQIAYAKEIFRETHGVPPIERPIKKLVNKVKRCVKSLVISEASCQDPELEMNPYNVNELLFLIQSAGILNVYIEFTDHGGELGTFLYFQKPNKA